MCGLLGEGGGGRGKGEEVKGLDEGEEMGRRWGVRWAAKVAAVSIAWRANVAVSSLPAC